MSPLSWVRRSRVSKPSRRCLFLDRDGVLNERVEGGYVLDWSGFVWRPGVIAALHDVTLSDLAIVIVSNQSCIGRGLVSADRIATIMERVVDELDRSDVHLNAWYCCPHTPLDGCQCRKPRAGMLREAALNVGLDLQSSYLIGDSESDIEAGRSVGCQTWKIKDPVDFNEAIAQVLDREQSFAATCEVRSS